MAIAFNFQAVAENHSLRTSLALMSQADYNFMEDWEPAQAKELKRTVIRMVLATDMSRHFEMLVQYKTKVVNSEAIAGKTGQEAYAAMDLNQRMMTLQMAMKVGAPTGGLMTPYSQPCSLPRSQLVVRPNLLPSKVQYGGGRVGIVPGITRLSTLPPSRRHSYTLTRHPSSFYLSTTWPPAI